MDDVFVSRTASSSSSSTSTLDPLILFESAVHLVFSALFQPARIERLVQQSLFYDRFRRKENGGIEVPSSSLPSFFEVIDTFLAYIYPDPSEKLYIPCSDILEMAILQEMFWNHYLDLYIQQQSKLSTFTLSQIYDVLITLPIRVEKLMMQESLTCEIGEEDMVSFEMWSNHLSYLYTCMINKQYTSKNAMIYTIPAGPPI
jgi:hypothetical protein